LPNFEASLQRRNERTQHCPKISVRAKIDPGTYFWCACGRSQGQPFCDGSHKGTGFAPLKIEIAEAKTVAWCGCKHTHNGCFCDGSHSKLP
jgi:CDGSH-type Zn-finger protein